MIGARTPPLKSVTKDQKLMGCDMKQKGFTLIELIFVVVLLGILSVIAVPKFSGLQNEARLAAAQGVKASLESAANLAFVQAVVEGVEGNDETTELKRIPGTVVQYGYPTAQSISKIVNLSGWRLKSVSNKQAVFVPDNQSGSNKECAVYYTPAKESFSYSVSISPYCGT